MCVYTAMSLVVYGNENLPYAEDDIAEEYDRAVAEGRIIDVCRAQ